MITFDSRCHSWAHACFGSKIADNVLERQQRFLEESLELCQTLGMTKDKALQLVDYAFAKEKGEPKQEVGGVMVTLAVLGAVIGIDMQMAGELELSRCWENLSKIRAKHAAKPEDVKTV